MMNRQSFFFFFFLRSMLMALAHYIKIIREPKAVTESFILPFWMCTAWAFALFVFLIQIWSWFNWQSLYFLFMFRYRGSFVSQNKRSSLFGTQSTGAIVFEELACGGEENSILNCSRSSPSNSFNCTHDNDVAVTCRRGMHAYIHVPRTWRAIKDTILPAGKIIGKGVKLCSSSEFIHMLKTWWSVLQW